MKTGSVSLVASFAVWLFGGQAVAQDIRPLQAINENIARIISNKPPTDTLVLGEIQVATLPAVVQWDDNGGRYAFNQLCDTLSSWGPEIKPSGIALSSRYMQYLLGIKTKQGDPLANKEQRKYADAASKAEKAYRKERLNLLKEWNDLVQAESGLPDANKTANTTFMLQNGAKLASLRISALNAYSLWQPYAQQAAPTTAGYILSKMLNPGSLVKVKTYSGADTEVLECSPSIDLKQELENAAKVVANGGKADLNLSYGKRTGQINSSWQSWGGGGGWGPFSVSASGSRSNVSVVTDNFSLTFEVPVIIRFNLTRPWMDLSIVQTYKDTEIIQGSELDALKPLFGEKGTFSLVPLEFIVGYKPRVIIKMDSSDYQSTKSNYNAGGSFSVGPFSVGGGTSGGSSVEKWDDQNNSITIGTKANSFVLLGVRNRVLP